MFFDFHHIYHIYGYVRNLKLQDKDIKEIFTEFQALTLVSSVDQKTPIFETYTSDFTDVKKIHMLLSQLKSISM
jgi:hypothetical protein